MTELETSTPFCEAEMMWVDGQLGHAAELPWDATVQIEERDEGWLFAVEFSSEEVYGGVAPVELVMREGFSSRGEARMAAERAIRGWVPAEAKSG